MEFLGLRLGLRLIAFHSLLHILGKSKSLPYEILFTVQHLVRELYKSLLEDDENFAGFDLK